MKYTAETCSSIELKLNVQDALYIIVLIGKKQWTNNEIKNMPS